MDRYRVGLILSIPEFDTYRGLERFARDPKKPEHKFAFDCLCKQAETRAVWHAVSNFGFDKIEEAVKLITGSLGEKSTSKHTADLTDFMDKTAAEQIEIFNRICEAAGVKVDPTT